MTASNATGGSVTMLPVPVEGGRGVALPTAPMPSVTVPSAGGVVPAGEAGDDGPAVDVPGTAGEGEPGTTGEGEPPIGVGGVAVPVGDAPGVAVVAGFVGVPGAIVDVAVAVAEGVTAVPVGTAVDVLVGCAGVAVAVAGVVGVAVGVAGGVVGVAVGVDPPASGTSPPAEPVGGGNACPDDVASCDAPTETGTKVAPPFGVKVTVKSAQPVPQLGLSEMPTTWIVPAALSITGGTSDVFQEPAAVTPVAAADDASNESVMSKPLNCEPASSPAMETVATPCEVLMTIPGLNCARALVEAKSEAIATKARSNGGMRWSVCGSARFMGSPGDAPGAMPGAGSAAKGGRMVTARRRANGGRARVDTRVRSHG